jgi:hypothetical protein
MREKRNPFIYEYGDDQRPLNCLHYLDSFLVMTHCGCELTAAGRPLDTVRPFVDQSGEEESYQPLSSPATSVSLVVRLAAKHLG